MTRDLTVIERTEYIISSAHSDELLLLCKHQKRCYDRDTQLGCFAARDPKRPCRRVLLDAGPPRCFYRKEELLMCLCTSAVVLIVWTTNTIQNSVESEKP